MGMLTDTGHNRMTGASVALRILDEARRDGIDDRDIVERSPAVLALAAPRVGVGHGLPSEAISIPIGTDCDNANDNGILREALRLRVRWLQELSGRAAWVIGERLTQRGEVSEPELVRHISLAHLESVVTRRAVVIPALVNAQRHPFGAPLPARFQLSDVDKVIRVVQENHVCGGTGAGGGVGRGPVSHDAENPPAGSVLVTTTLRPGLGPLLSRLNGIVAETGSVLSHLAILAREAGVAIVVGFAEATDELPDGAVVTVDGNTGQVSIEEGETS
jgi:pyruvate,water dikinase